MIGSQFVGVLDASIRVIDKSGFMRPTVAEPVSLGDVLINNSLVDQWVRVFLEDGSYRDVLVAAGSVVQMKLSPIQLAALDNLFVQEVVAEPVEDPIVLAQAETAAAAAGSSAGAAGAGISAAGVAAAGAVAVGVASAAGGGSSGGGEGPALAPAQQNEPVSMDPPAADPEPDPADPVSDPVAEDGSDPSTVDLDNLTVKLSSFRLTVEDVDAVEFDDASGGIMVADLGGIVTIADGESNSVVEGGEVTVQTPGEGALDSLNSLDGSAFLTENESGKADVNLLGTVLASDVELLGASAPDELLPLETLIGVLRNLVSQVDLLVDSENLSEILNSPVDELVDIQGLAVAEIPVITESDEILTEVPAIAEIDSEAGRQVGESDGLFESRAGDAFAALEVVDEALDLPGLFDAPGVGGGDDGGAPSEDAGGGETGGSEGESEGSEPVAEGGSGDSPEADMPAMPGEDLLGIFDLATSPAAALADIASELSVIPEEATFV